VVNHEAKTKEHLPVLSGLGGVLPDSIAKPTKLASLRHGVPGINLSMVHYQQFAVTVTEKLSTSNGLTVANKPGALADINFPGFATYSERPPLICAIQVAKTSSQKGKQVSCQLQGARSMEHNA
jgi:hypothetical protein